MEKKAQFTLDSARRIAAATRTVENQALSLYGQQQPTFRPGVATPHFATPVTTTGITVGLGRGLTGRAPERVYISYRGAVIEIAKATAEALTGITASGYVVYEVVCTAGTWTATAAFSTTMTGLTDTGKIYIPIAKVTCAGSVITAVYQQLWDNPTVHIGSPQYSITVDTANGRLELDGDAASPGPLMVYATNATGDRGWVPYADICAYCAGEPPENSPPCGDCSELPDCLDFGEYEPTDCGSPCTSGYPAWDGKVYLQATQCMYTALVDGSNIVSINGCAHSIFYYRYQDNSDPEAPFCYWTLIIRRYPSGDIVWRGTTADADEQGTITRTEGCDSTATISLTLCLRTIRVTISGIAFCTCMLARYDITSATYNGTYDLIETGPGTGVWELDSDIAPADLHPIDYDIYPDTFGDERNCDETPTPDNGNRVTLVITYDEATTWTIALTSWDPPFAADVSLFGGTDSAGDADGATMSNDVGSCAVSGAEMSGGTATIEVL